MEKCPRLSTCPEAQGGAREKWASRRCGWATEVHAAGKDLGPDNPAVTESVGSTGGGAGRLSVCLDAEGREESRGAEFLSLEFCEFSPRGSFVHLSGNAAKR